MRLKNAFTDWSDVWHAALGFAASIVRYLHPLGFVASLAILLVYVVYQALDAESRTDSYEDLVEFLVGFIFGEALSSTLTCLSP